MLLCAGGGWAGEDLPCCCVLGEVGLGRICHVAVFWVLGL